MWDQYFNHYQPRQTEITKVKLATLNDVRKNWIRNISLCIKLLKCELIQILKRSLNLRDCLSHFDFKKLILQMSLFFLFIAPRVPTVDTLKKKGLFFRLVKKWYHSCLSVCLLLLFHTRGSSQVSVSNIFRTLRYHQVQADPV